jgi:hypothetical protein
MEKLVESYWIKDIGNHQYYLVVNLMNKSTEIQHNHGGMFQVWEDNVSEDFKPEGLPDMDYYSVFMSRCKDQVYFLLLPTHEIVRPGKRQDRMQEEFFKHLLPKNIKEEEESLEQGVLQKIKFALFCKNEAIALRLLEQYRFDITEEMYSEEDMKKAIKFGAFGMYGYQMGEEGKEVNQIKTFLETFKKK